MEKIINTTSTVVWQAPVRVRVGNGLAETVRGPEEALHYLSYRWPRAEGAGYDTARLTCLRALQKRVECAKAREAFIVAAKEARMLA
jgi:hypothetical protein